MNSFYETNFPGSALIWLGLRLLLSLVGLV